MKPETHIKISDGEPPSTYWYPLFKHMQDNHGLTLLDSEMVEIALACCDCQRQAACDQVRRVLPMPVATGQTQPDPTQVGCHIENREYGP